MIVRLADPLAEAPLTCPCRAFKEGMCEEGHTLGYRSLGCTCGIAVFFCFGVQIGAPKIFPQKQRFTLGLRVQDFGLKVQGIGFRIQCLWFRI